MGSYLSFGSFLDHPNILLAKLTIKSFVFHAPQCYDFVFNVQFMNGSLNPRFRPSNVLDNIGVQTVL